MRLGATAALLALAAVAGATGAQPAGTPAFEWGVSAGALHRRLVERGDDGRTLVTESGPLLRLGLEGSLAHVGGGVLRAEAEIASGELDYAGRTQGGVPLESRSGARDLALSLQWRPWPARDWGEAWFTLQALQQRRQIASTPAASGLRETSTLLAPGLRYAYRFTAAGWSWQPAIELRASVHHRLEVDFGGVFDDARLRGGRRRELVLGVDAAAPGSAWRWGLAWTRARQSASTAQEIRRNGVAASTARQPRITIDDVQLRVTRSF